MAFHNEIHQDKLTYEIIGLAIDLHKRLGADLAEHLYRDILCSDLNDAGYKAVTEHEVEIIDRGRVVARRYIDLMVEDQVVLELKAVRVTNDDHLEQLGANVRAASVRRGLLLNFGTKRLSIRRWINPSLGSS